MNLKSLNFGLCGIFLLTACTSKDMNTDNDVLAHYVPMQITYDDLRKTAFETSKVSSTLDDLSFFFPISENGENLIKESQDESYCTVDKLREDGINNEKLAIMTYSLLKLRLTLYDYFPDNMKHLYPDYNNDKKAFGQLMMNSINLGHYSCTKEERDYKIHGENENMELILGDEMQKLKKLMLFLNDNKFDEAEGIDMAHRNILLEEATRYIECAYELSILPDSLEKLSAEAIRLSNSLIEITLKLSNADDARLADFEEYKATQTQQARQYESISSEKKNKLACSVPDYTKSI